MIFLIIDIIVMHLKLEMIKFIKKNMKALLILSKPFLDFK